MELELGSGGEGSRSVSLSVDSPTADLGRGDLAAASGGGSPSADRTVSRRHVSLRLLDGGGEPGVAFEVVGRNPVVVRSPDGGRSSVFRHGEKGELRPGQALSLSLKAPAFWAVRRREGNGEDEVEVEAAVLDAVARREKRTRERKERESKREREKRAAEGEVMEVTEEEEEGAAGSEAEGMEIDLASVDPVREFGFLSMGHEFDSYPKGRIRAPKDWNWFLEETKRTSDDEDVEVSNRRGRSKASGRNKKNKDGEGDNEDWTDESEDEKESLARGPSVKRSKYVTRSKDPKKPRQESSKVSSADNNDDDEEVEEEEDEEDETLGGFVVNDGEDEPMEELSDEEDEEEEFDDEEDDD